MFKFNHPDIQECLKMPCMNEGRCIDLEDGFRCECPPAYTGEYCQSDANECERGNPCQHEGTCLTTHGSYRCRCKEGWKGHNCEIGQYGSASVDIFLIIWLYTLSDILVLVNCCFTDLLIYLYFETIKRRFF